MMRLWFVLLIVAAACRPTESSKMESEGTAAPVVVASPNPAAAATTNEAAAATNEAAAARDALRARASRGCERPLLSWSHPLPGPADTDAVAALFGPVAKACDLGELTHTDTFRHGMAAKEVDALREVDRSCKALIESMKRAVRHEDACSPLRPGRVGTPAEDELTLLDEPREGASNAPSRLQLRFSQLSRLGIAASVHAWLLHEDGDTQAGLETLLECAHLSQDLARGGVRFLDANIALAAGKICLETGQSILNAAPRLTLKNATLRKAVEVLLNSVPHPSENFETERDLWINEVLGGQTHGTEQERREDEIVLRAFRETASESLSDCPPGSSLEACHSKLVERSEKLAAGKVSKANLGDFQKQKPSAADIDNKSVLTMKLQAAQETPRAILGFIGYARRLAGLRLHLHLSPTLLAKDCLRSLASAAPIRPALVLDPAGGDALVLQSTTTGAELRVGPRSSTEPGVIIANFVCDSERQKM